MEELPGKKERDDVSDENASDENGSSDEKAEEQAEEKEEAAATVDTAAAATATATATATAAVEYPEQTKAFEIAEFSDRSASNSSNSNASDSDDGSSENKHEEEGEEESGTPRSDNISGGEVKEDHQPPSLDVAEAKGNAAASRAHAQPESKRGGRRDTARTGGILNRWVGRRKSRHEIGDLVEAEWAGSRWWYVGYVEREVPVVAGDKQKKKGFYHVVFADGDEADVDGRHLKQLGPSDHAKGSAGTLPRHIPIFDLRSGSLHRNLKEKKNVVPPFQGGRGEEERGGQKLRKGRGQNKKQNNSKKGSGRFGRSSSPRRGGTDDDSPSGTQEGEDSGSSSRGTGRGASMPRVAPLARRGSMGNVDDRRKQGQRAVWGRHSPKSSGGRGGRQEDDDDVGGGGGKLKLVGDGDAVRLATASVCR